MGLLKRNYKYFLLLPLTAALLTGCGKKEEGEQKPVVVNDTVTVQVTKAVISDIKLTKVYSGNFEGEEQANVSSKLAERIISLKAKIGEAVKEGQVIVSLDKSGATSQYYQAEAAFLNASKDLDRMKALLKEGAISQQMLDGAQTNYNISKANFDAAKSAVEIIAPISGVVTAVNMNVGDVATPGLPIVTIANIRNMKAIFGVGEAEVSSFAAGQYVDIYSDLKPDLIQKGKIVQISKSADITSRSFEVKAVFANTKDNWYKPGMFCRVNTVLKSKSKCVAIPNAAITNTEKGNFAFVITDGKASMRNLQTGITDGKMTEIISGINDGETVATMGMNNLKEGKFVRINSK
jgi:RND family efflux transporter MFP subunit